MAVPDFFTVEEAARVIRVGRTKAYAMTAEWRVTGGRSGLPVVDFGHTLRVPRAALEQLIGGELTGNRVPARPRKRADGPRRAEVPNQPAASDDASAPVNGSATTQPIRRRRRNSAQATNQLDLFNSEPDAS